MTDIIKNYIYSSPIFKRNTKIVRVQGAFNNLEGSATKINFSSTLKASLGEFTERLVQLSRPKDYNGIIGYDVINKKVIQLNYSDAFLLRNRSSYNSEHDFADSSGTAFFTNTDKAIEKAMFEFVERQSLLHSFLCKWPGYKVESKMINEALASYNKYDFTTIYVNDISIVNGISIVIFVGTNSNSYNVGLGADYSTLNAVKKAVFEGMGTGQFSISSEEIGEREKSIAQLDTELSQKDTSSVSYSAIFFGRLIPSFIEERFHYLVNGEKKLDKKEQQIVLLDQNNTIENLKYIGTELDIKPIIIFLGNGPNGIKVGDIIKIRASGCYPHIFTPLLNPEKYNISFKVNENSIFYNKNKYLPFP